MLLQTAASLRRADYEAVLKERDARIAELEGEIAEAAKTAEGEEKLSAETDELRRGGDEERVGFELQLAWACNVKAARALLADHDGDIERLKAAEPWFFSATTRATWATRPARSPTSSRPRRSTTTAASSCSQQRNRSVPLSRMSSSLTLPLGAQL